MVGLLKDEVMFKEFIKNIVPELERDEVIIGILAARKKYVPELSRSDEILDKIIVKREEDVFRKFRKFMRVEKGDYIDFNTGQEIPLNAMVCYIDLNPKSSIKALNTFFKEMDDWKYQAIVDHQFDLSQFRKLDTKVFSALARRVSRRLYFLVDVDDTELNRYPSILPDPLWISRTRGGYHLIYSNSKEIRSEVYNTVSQYNLNVEIQKEVQTPVPGSLQGGRQVYPCIWR